MNVETGKSSYFEIKGKGKAGSKWFKAEKTSSGTYELTAMGKKNMEAANNDDTTFLIRKSTMIVKNERKIEDVYKIDKKPLGTGAYGVVSRVKHKETG